MRIATGTALAGVLAGLLFSGAAAQIAPCSVVDDTSLFAGVAGDYQVAFHPGAIMLGDQVSVGVPEWQHFSQFRIRLRVSGGQLVAEHASGQREWAPDWGFSIPLQRVNGTGQFMAGYFGDAAPWQYVDDVPSDADLVRMGGCPLAQLPRLSGQMQVAVDSPNISGPVTRRFDLVYTGEAGIFGVLRDEFHISDVGAAVTMDVVHLMLVR